LYNLSKNPDELALSLTEPDVEGYDESDHRSFWEEDYQAILIIGAMADFEDHYHSATDTPDTLDYDSMAQLLQGISSVLAELVK
jgi:hypothetical protein